MQRSSSRKRAVNRKPFHQALVCAGSFTFLLAGCSFPGNQQQQGPLTGTDAGSGGSVGTGATGPGAGGVANGGSGAGAGTTASGGTTGTTASGGTTPSGGTTGTSAMANPPPGSPFFIGSNFWNIDWEGTGNYFQASVDFSTVANPWRPDLISDIAPYSVLRFMDWNLINTSNNPQAVWGTRRQKTATQGEPVAFEWQIDLCNRSKKDYWLNVPHEANAQYWQNLATLVHDQLDPSLRVYVEWSNEVWNSGFPQHQYAVNQASSLGLGGSIPWASYYAYEAVRVFEAFEAVFGKGSPRLVKVMAGQAAWTGPCDAEATALSDSKVNPNHTKPDAYAIAPYLTGSSISELTGALSTVTGWVQAAKGCATSLGVPLISYEGGTDSFAAGSGCQTLQQDPGMYSLYQTYLGAISGAGMSGPFLQYTHTGACWGLKVKTGDSLSVSPKYKSVVDWIAAH